MRIPVVGVVLSTALMFTSGAEARDRITNIPHVRPMTPEAVALVADAGARAPAVGELVRKLEQGNVIAYVHLAPAKPGGPSGSLQFLGRSLAQRFVMITVDSQLPEERQMALLGHELQHAVEISQVPWVASQSDARTLLGLIGWRDGTRAGGFETSAALVAERQVSREVGAGGVPKP